MQKKACNTAPAPRPKQFGKVIHFDIIYGSEISIGNIYCGLLFTDQFI